MSVLLLGVAKHRVKDFLPSNLPLSSAIQECIRERLVASDFSGKLGETRLLYGFENDALPSNIAVVGLGSEHPDNESVDALKQSTRLAASKALSFIKSSFNSCKIEIVVNPLNNDACSTAEGLLLSNWEFDEFKTKKAKTIDFRLIPGMSEASKDWDRGLINAKAQNIARRLAECPANRMTPALFSEYAVELLGDCVKIRDYKWIKNQGMNSFLSVSRGSEEPPYFLEIDYNSTNANKIALVGKGVTFDSGGISIKPSTDMALMKADMSGAAVVLSTVWAAKKLGLPIGVAAAIPLTENMPSGKATKPGDVVIARNKKSIEVDNTDAEGRLILADAIHYICEKHSPKTCIELSTLTGAIDVALGYHYVGAFCSSSSLWEQIEASGREAGDPFWRMPFHPSYLKQMKSAVADLKNVGGRSGGSCTAAAFLAEFVPRLAADHLQGTTAFAHLDIAGVMHSKSAQGYLSSGMTGRPTRAMIQLLEAIQTSS